MKLKVGEKGDSVRHLQRRLKELGYNPGPIDGIFNINTKEAIRRFQKHNDLVTDSMVGSNTLNALGLRSQLHPPKTEREIRRGVFTPRRG